MTEQDECPVTMTYQGPETRATFACRLPAGHQGLHESFARVTWSTPGVDIDPKVRRVA